MAPLYLRFPSSYVFIRSDFFSLITRTLFVLGSIFSTLLQVADGGKTRSKRCEVAATEGVRSGLYNIAIVLIAFRRLMSEDYTFKKIFSQGLPFKNQVS